MEDDGTTSLTGPKKRGSSRNRKTLGGWSRIRSGRDMGVCSPVYSVRIVVDQAPGLRFHGGEQDIGELRHDAVKGGEEPDRAAQYAGFEIVQMQDFGQ